MNEDVEAIVQRETADLRREIASLRTRLDQADRNGLDALRFRNLKYHALPYVTEVPTEDDEDGSPRIVETGGVRYFYARTSAGWERVQLS